MTDDEAIAHARGALQSGNVAEAENVARQMLAHDSHHIEATHLLAVCLARRGAIAEALPLFETVAGGQPKSAGAHNNLGSTLSSLGRHAEALACFDAAIELDPRAAVAHGNRGNALKALGRVDEALASYASALALAPEHARLRYNRGTALIAMRRYLEALADLDWAVILDPREASYGLNRGSARFDCAVSPRRSTTSTGPSRSIAGRPGPCVPATCLRELGRPDEALAALRPPSRSNPACRTWPASGSSRSSRAATGTIWRCHRRLMDVVDRRARERAVPLLALPSSPTCNARAHSFRRRSMAGDTRTRGGAVTGPRSYARRLFLRRFGTTRLPSARGCPEHHDRAHFEVTAFSFGPEADDPWRSALRPPSNARRRSRGHRRRDRRAGARARARHRRRPQGIRSTRDRYLAARGAIAGELAATRVRSARLTSTT